MPNVVGKVFTCLGQDGDFSWMVRQPEHRRDLFVFNDDESRMGTSVRGAGSACVRPYNIVGYSSIPGLDRPMAVGIPTGPRARGYKSLAEGKPAIDFQLAHLQDVISMWEYETVFFAEGKGGLIGCSIFTVPEEVRVYITAALRAQANS